MYPNNEMAQEDPKGVPARKSRYPQTNFQPLRHGLQKVIDRRFYRSKYDAAKMLANFSTTLRNEVNLAQLNDHLVTVVQETMQPSFVYLWLRKPDRNTPSRDQKTLVRAAGFDRPDP